MNRRSATVFPSTVFLWLFAASLSVGYFGRRKMLPGAAEAGSVASGALAISAGNSDAAGAASAGGAVFQEARAFLQSLTEAGLEDFPGIWDDRMARPQDDPQWEIPTARQLLVIGRWAELDPAGALAFVKKQNSNSLLVSHLFTVWSDSDPEAALQAIKDEADAGIQTAAAAIGWLQAVKDDPAGLLERAGRLRWMDVSLLKKEKFNERIPPGLMAELYAAAPKELKGLADWMPPWFGEMLEALEWSNSLRSDPDQALAKLETMPLTAEKTSEMLDALEPLARSKPERVADLLLKLAERPGDPLITENTWSLGRRQLLETLMTTLGPKDPERMRDVLSKINASFAGGEILTDTLLNSHLREALIMAPALPSAGIWSDSVFAPPAARDAAGVLEAVREAPPSFSRDRLMETALLDLQGRDPAAVQAWMDSLPEGEIRKSAQLTLDLRDAAPEMRMLDRFGKTKREDGSPGQDTKEQLQALMTIAMMGDLPEASRRVAQWPAGELRDEALAFAGSRAVLIDNPGLALEWASTLPEESQRAAAHAGIAGGWTRTDPIAASEWIATLPEGAVRESAIGAFASGIAARDPEAGLQWAASLRDPGQRQERLREVAEAWKGRDPAAAAEGIRSLPELSEADRTALLSPPP